MNPRRNETITRAELVQVVTEAASAEGIAASTREKLIEVAQTANAVAAGWFFCGEVDCPTRQARRKNQRFQELFDRAMADRFGRYFNEDPWELHPFEPFVVEVED